MNIDTYLKLFFKSEFNILKLFDKNTSLLVNSVTLELLHYHSLIGKVTKRILRFFDTTL